MCGRGLTGLHFAAPSEAPWPPCLPACPLSAPQHPRRLQPAPFILARVCLATLCPGLGEVMAFVALRLIYVLVKTNQRAASFFPEVFFPSPSPFHNPFPAGASVQLGDNRVQPKVAARSGSGLKKKKTRKKNKLQKKKTKENTQSSLNGDRI